MEKLRVASDHQDAAKAPAWENMIVSVLHDPAKSSYEQNVSQMQGSHWDTARKTAYDASIAMANDANNPTADVHYL